MKEYQKQTKNILSIVLLIFIGTINAKGQLTKKDELFILEYENIELGHGSPDTANDCNIVIIDVKNNGGPVLEYWAPEICKTFDPNWVTPSLIDTSFQSESIGNSNMQGDSIFCIKFGAYDIRVKPRLGIALFFRDSNFIVLKIDSQYVDSSGEILFKLIIDDIGYPHPYKKCIWLSSKLYIVRIIEMSQEKRRDMYLKSILMYKKREGYYFKSAVIEMPTYYPK